jgi:DNA-binding FrmR family transcriptional regulator
MMNIPSDDRDLIIKRLRRIEGQLRGLQAMVDEGRDCSDTLTQFTAVSKAMDKAAFRFFSATYEQCKLRPAEAAENGYTSDELEKMFLRLG